MNFQLIRLCTGTVASRLRVLALCLGWGWGVGVPCGFWKYIKT